jgi:hypothetical protein
VSELEKHPHIQLSCPTLQILHDNLEPNAPSAVMGTSISAGARAVANGLAGAVTLRN